VPPRDAPLRLWQARSRSWSNSGPDRGEHILQHRELAEWTHDLEGPPDPETRDAWGCSF